MNDIDNFQMRYFLSEGFGARLQIVKFGIDFTLLIKLAYYLFNGLTEEERLLRHRQRNLLITASKQHKHPHICLICPLFSCLTETMQQVQRDITHTPWVCVTAMKHGDWGIHCFYSKIQARLLFVLGNNIIISLKISSCINNSEK